MSTSTHLMTAEELIQLEVPNRHELIKGELLTMPPPGEDNGAVVVSLAIEVLSLSDRKSRVEQKTALWLDLGAKAVWLVNPKRRTVEVIHAGGERWLFHETDEVVDDTVPGFRVAISEIFA